VDTFVLETKTIEVPYYNINYEAKTTALLITTLLAMIGLIIMVKITNQAHVFLLNESKFFIYLVISFVISFILILLIFTIIYSLLRDKKWRTFEAGYSIVDKNRPVGKFSITKTDEVKNFILTTYYNYKKEEFAGNKIMVVRYQRYYYIFELFLEK